MVCGVDLTTLCRFSLVKHPRLMEICREKGIAVEVCPISYVGRRLFHASSFFMS